MRARAGRCVPVSSPCLCGSACFLVVLAVFLHAEARRKGGWGQIAAYMFRLLVSAALREFLCS